MPDSSKYVRLGEPYKHVTERGIFIVSSFGIANTDKTANDLLMQVLESKVMEKSAREKFAESFPRNRQKTNDETDT